MGTAEATKVTIGCNTHCIAANQLNEAIGVDQDSFALAEQISKDAAEHVAKCDFIKTGQCALVGYMAENTVAMRMMFEEEQET